MVMNLCSDNRRCQAVSLYRDEGGGEPMYCLKGDLPWPLQLVDKRNTTMRGPCEGIFVATGEELTLRVPLTLDGWATLFTV